MDASLTPATVCDVLLDAAITADADSLWLEHRAGAEDRYDLSIERQGRALATSSLDGALGAAVVARLALLADIDLVSRRPASGSCVVRLPRTSAEIVVTTRPGRSPRAEVFVRNLSRPRVAAAAPAKTAGGAQLGQYTIESRLGAGSPMPTRRGNACDGSTCRPA